MFSFSINFSGGQIKIGFIDKDYNNMYGKSVLATYYVGIHCDSISISGEGKSFTTENTRKVMIFESQRMSQIKRKKGENIRNVIKPTPFQI